MKLAIQLNNLLYIYDYLSMGVDLFIVGGEYSSGAILNLSIDEIKQVKEKVSPKRVYVMLNGLYDQHEIKSIEDYLYQLEGQVDGLLFQDFGVLQIVKENHYHFDMMYAPDSLNTNGLSLEALSHYGITSAFVSGIIPMEEQCAMKQQCSIPLMIQGHGVEYMACSKRYLLTNYQEATGKKLDMTQPIIMKPRDSDYDCYIFEDKRGTHIYSQSRLYTLDLLNTLKVFDYLYIETLMMEDQEAIEVISIYSDCIRDLDNGKYDKEVKEFLPLLKAVSPHLDRGFLFDKSVYKLEDMRKIENERNQ